MYQHWTLLMKVTLIVYNINSMLKLAHYYLLFFYKKMYESISGNL